MKYSKLDEAQLRNGLMLYGADVTVWPQNMQAAGRWAIRQPEFAAIIREEEFFEKRLLDRLYEPPISELADRIIAASLTRKQDPASAGIMTGTHPATYAAMLVLGFALGFGALSASTLTNETLSAQESPALPDDEGASL
jgi:hypothetical protein